MGIELFEIDSQFDKERYSNKISKIQYTPKSKVVPDIESCYNLKKYRELVEQIDKSNIDENIKKFLRFSATRHIVFDYETIAEYYCHADKEVQELMEQSGLVIIDFNDAMENGFVKMTKNLEELYEESNEK